MPLTETITIIEHCPEFVTLSEIFGQSSTNFPFGNARTRALRQLRDKRPDLHARVLAVKRDPWTLVCVPSEKDLTNAVLVPPEDGD